MNSKRATIERVWELFHQLNQVPRPSHHEEKAADFLCQYAKACGLDYERDSHNCVVIRKPATKGCEDWVPIVLLNHMDMVCVGDGSRPFNPLTDTIESQIKDGWMSAKGTSLGADNGIGLSIALALIGDDSLQHGPLEVLTTTNEEDGMSGAANLSADFIKGRKVINLDSEDYDTITVGAAGAYMQRHQWNFTLQPTHATLSYYKITLKGGKGGHSGVDINKGRGNAIKLLFELLGKLDHVQIGRLEGGSSAAAIPGEAYATIGVKTDKPTLQRIGEEFLKPYIETDPFLHLEIERCEAVALISTEDSSKLIEAINGIPNGVVSMREDMPETVKTSNNIGVLKQTEGQMEISTHTRSFSDQDMMDLGQEIAQTVKQYGGHSILEANSPAWQENDGSAFINKVSRTFEEELGFTPKKVAMHFVLEAGYYVKKYPGIEIACIGPRIVEPHSTNERVEMSTVEDILKVAKRLVTEKL